jgi:ubiquinone biosynthesis UbiH/UbiF/VisC/COQ6 family hydroxylase
MNAANRGNVLIVGAGPVGLCLARALAGYGLDVDVVERQPDAALVAPAYDGFEVNAASFGKDILGNFVSNHVIRAAAWQAAQDSATIRLHTGAGVEAIERENAAPVVRLSDGRRLSAPLLVAADSRFSQSRRLLGVPVAMHDFGKTMLVCRLHHETPHEHVAREWFGRGQTRALLPLDEHMVSLVLTVTGREAAALQDLDEVAFARDIERRLDGRLGAMRLASTRHTYPLVATWAKQFAGPGFALVGDAAVGMHPVTAHGFNLGLASADRLAAAIGSALARHRGVADPGALARYQWRHRAGALPLFVATGMIVGLYTDDSVLAQPLRHAVLGGMRRLRPLRDVLAAAVMDVPPSRRLFGVLRGVARSPE